MTQIADRTSARHLEAHVVERRYTAATRRLRVNAFSFLVGAGATAAWLIAGAYAGDYTPGAAFGLVLVATSGFTLAMLAFSLAPVLAREPKSELLAVLAGADPDIRNRRRFLARLTFQCEAALERRADWFGLLVLRSPSVLAGTSDRVGTVAFVSDAIRRSVRTFDVIGDSEDDEIWVLLMGADPEGCGTVRDRLRWVFAADGRSPDDMAIGWSAFDIDGRTPATLFRNARRRLSVVLVSHRDA